MKHTPMAMIVLLGLLALWGTEPRSASSDQRDVEIVEVDIQYEPGEVRITRGQTIRIINQDPFFHMTRISRLEADGTEGPGVFGPHVELPETNVEVRLTEPGRYKLRCLIHDGMTALIQVIG